MSGSGGARTFAIHGLAMESAFPLSARSIPSVRHPELRITASGGRERRPVGRILRQHGIFSAFRSSDHRWAIRYAYGPERCTFVANQREHVIDARYTSTVSPDRPLLALEGTILSAWMQELGYFCFHACAVNVGGGAVLISGQSGMGKSTTAAALVSQGFPLLAEELVPIGPWERNDGPVVAPGSSTLKISASAARMLGWDPALLSVISDHAVFPDHRVHLDTRSHGKYAEAPAPLRAILALRAGDRKRHAPAIRRLGHAEALARMSALWHPSPLDDGTYVSRMMRPFFEIVLRIPMFDVEVPDLSRIDGLGSAIARTLG